MATNEPDKAPRKVPGDWLLGKAFGTSFRVIALGDDPDHTVYLAMADGERHAISLEELETLISSGLVIELNERGGRA